MSEHERKTVDRTDICIPCGYVFCDDDDYDTLGAVGPVCCPDCGSERFITVATLITQRDALKAACKGILKIEKGCLMRGIGYDAEIYNLAKAALAQCNQESKQSVRPRISS